MSMTTTLFSERLRSEMDRQDLSPESLAADCKIRAITIERWMRGQTEPQVGLAGRAAIALGVSLDWLAGLTDDRGGA